MAECPYARCIQERRHIRRELLRWTKNMVFVVGLERVAEELMGRRRWKQYQDTLYSSTRSESANQPHHHHHHRLYPGTALSSSCNVVTVGGGGGGGVGAGGGGGGGGGSIGGQQVVAQRPQSAIGEIGLVQGASTIELPTDTTTSSSILRTETSTVTTGSASLMNDSTSATTTTTATTTTPTSTEKKLNCLQQRNSLNQLSNHRGNTNDNDNDDDDDDDVDEGENHEEHENLQQSSRLRPESIKLEINELNESLLSRESRPGSCVISRQTNNNIQEELATSGEKIIKHEGREYAETENGERDLIEDIRTDCSEKRLKILEDSSLRQNSTRQTTGSSPVIVSPLRENETRTLSREQETGTSDLVNTIGNKQTEERIEGATTGLLRVKKEEELQEVPRSISCGVDASSITRLGNIVDTTNSEVYKVTEQTGPDTVVPYLINRRASPPPEDWKPLDKCFFCLDGKLAHDEQPPLSPQSESSSSSRSAESPMSVQVDPMAASVVAAALSGTYPTLLPQWCLPPRESPLVAVAGHQDAATGVDQPLDLSAKPKIFQDNHVTMAKQQKIPLRMPTGIDPKSLFTSSYRAKPRMTGPVGVGGVPVVGAGGSRRTYTEEELQAALRDIQSGKLGTRRAAVIYGIPRSTLRNKVYKLTMERERDATLNSTHSHPLESGAQASTTTTTNATNTTTMTTTTTSTTTTTTTRTTTSTTELSTTRTTSTTTPSPNTIQNASATTPPPQVDEIEDKDLSGAEEEKEVEKALLRPLLSLEDLVRFSALEGSGSDSLRSLLQRGQETGTEWPGFEHANIGPYIQKMLGAAAPFKGLETPDYRIPEVMRRLMSEDKRLNKDVNGDHMQQLHQHHLHHGQQQQQQHHHHPHHQQAQQQLGQQSGQHRGPITNEDFNPSIEEEASDSGQGRAILKIPSYKPASSTPGSSKNNGEPNSAAFAQSFAASAAGSPVLLERTSPAFSGTSSPTNSIVGKGVSVNFREVIANTINKKFQEGQSSLGGQAGSMVHSPTAMMTESNPFKRGRYTPPQTSQSQQPKPQSQQDKSKPNAGGKGTRPKRGKYRNYDRDSLVEAVRAVQRGEMSVHRAGSFYGVPHSTLEYKVKERHLMRPRKRDQKQPDDKSKDSSGGGSSMRSSLADKKPQSKPQKAFASSPGGMPGGPNGLKMPSFLEGMAPLPFPHPFNFWGPTPFMPSPFMPGGPNVPTILPEQYFATQRMRGLQEQQRSAIVQQQAQREREGIVGGASSAGGGGGAGGGSTEPGTSNSRISSMVKSTREIAESLYDGTGANGSFLDNLIRSSLEAGIPRDQQAIAEAHINQQQQQQLRDRERDQRERDHLPEAMSTKALIDQLCRNSRRTPLPRMTQDSSEDESYRGPTTRTLPDRPERVPTVDLSQSPTERSRIDEQCNDRLTSPPTPMSISRTGSRDEDNTRESMRLLDRCSRERDIHNGGQQQQDDREHRKTHGSMQSQQINHYPEMHSLYPVSNDKKSACDSKLIVDHSSQKPQQQQQQQQQHKELGNVGGLVVQLQRGYNTSSGRNSTTTSPTTTSANINDQAQNNTLSNAIGGQSNSGPHEQRGSTVLPMEESVEQ